MFPSQVGLNAHRHSCPPSFFESIFSSNYAYSAESTGKNTGACAPVAAANVIKRKQSTAQKLSKMSHALSGSRKRSLSWRKFTSNFNNFKIVTNMPREIQKFKGRDPSNIEKESTTEMNIIVEATSEEETHSVEDATMVNAQDASDSKESIGISKEGLIDYLATYGKEESLLSSKSSLLNHSVIDADVEEAINNFILKIWSPLSKKSKSKVVALLEDGADGLVADDILISKLKTQMAVSLSRFEVDKQRKPMLEDAVILNSSHYPCID